MPEKYATPRACYKRVPIRQLSADERAEMQKLTAPVPDAQREYVAIPQYRDTNLVLAK